RFRAAEALGNIGLPDPQAVEPLIQALGDGIFEVRQEAVDALTRIGSDSKDGALALCRAYQSDEKITRGQVLDSLGKIFAQIKWRKEMADEEARRQARPQAVSLAQTSQSIYGKKLEAQATATAVAIQEARQAKLAKKLAAKPKPKPPKRTPTPAPKSKK